MPKWLVSEYDKYKNLKNSVSQRKHYIKIQRTDIKNIINHRKHKTQESIQRVIK